MENYNRFFIVVDDDPMNNKICQFIIKQVHDSANVKVFTQGEAALSYITNEYSKQKNTKAAVLFLDLNMPVMTGWEFLERYKELDSEIQNNFKIYILSSSVDERDKERAAREPVIKGFISKPISKEIILSLE
ncbi:MAG: response regulator [Ignavibacteria bacterium]|nr:response regulator [Ignavibacteria bacterium]